QEHWRADIHGVHSVIRKSFSKVWPDAYAIGSRFRGIASDEAIEMAAGLGLDCGDDPASRDVANSDDDPVEHARWMPTEKQRPATAGLRNPFQLDKIAGQRLLPAPPLCRSCATPACPEDSCIRPWITQSEIQSFSARY